MRLFLMIVGLHCVFEVLPDHTSYELVQLDLLCIYLLVSSSSRLDKLDIRMHSLELFQCMAVDQIVLRDL